MENWSPHIHILTVLSCKINLYFNHTETCMALGAQTILKELCFHHQLHLVIKKK